MERSRSLKFFASRLRIRWPKRLELHGRWILLVSKQGVCEKRMNPRPKSPAVGPGPRLDAPRMRPMNVASSCRKSRAQKRVLRSGEAPYLDAAMQHSIDLFGTPYETGEPAQHMQDFLQRKR